MILLRDIVWVGAPFVAVVNYKVNKHTNWMRNIIILFAFSKAQCGTLKLQCPIHRDLNTSEGFVIGTALRMNNKEGI